MRIGSRVLWVALGVVSLGMQGCVSYSQPFMGPTGDVKTCASTNQNADCLAGPVLAALASSRFNTCVETIKAQGYKEVETVGAIGILLYEADASGLKIRKVYDNSPAARAGIVRGDIIVAIDDHKVMQSHDIAATYGAPGSSVTITVNRNGTLATYTLMRAKCVYSRILGDVTF